MCALSVLGRVCRKFLCDLTFMVEIQTIFQLIICNIAPSLWLPGLLYIFNLSLSLPLPRWLSIGRSPPPDNISYTYDNPGDSEQNSIKLLHPKKHQKHSRMSILIRIIYFTDLSESQVLAYTLAAGKYPEICHLNSILVSWNLFQNNILDQEDTQVIITKQIAIFRVQIISLIYSFRLVVLFVLLLHYFN